MPKTIIEIAEEVGKIVEEKDKAYGSAFSKIPEILKILYPNGVPPEKYFDLIFTVRILDKLSRIANDPNAFSEDPYRDIAGYGFAGAVENIKRQEAKKPQSS